MSFVPGLPSSPLDATAAQVPGPPTALLVTADPGVREQVLTAAESVGTVVRVEPPEHPDAFWWARARLVLLGPDVDPDTLPGPRGQIVLLAGSSGRAPDGPAGERLTLPQEHPRLLDLLARSRAETGAPVLGVLAATGGAGASTLACALALTAPATDGPTLLVDGDPLGPGLQTALGWEGVAGVRWSDLARVDGRLRPGALTAALPTRGDLMLLSYDRACPAVPRGPGAHHLSAVLDAARLDCHRLVVDLPRRCEPADLLVWQSLGAVVVLTSGTVGGVVCAARLVETLRGLGPRVAVVVRGGGLSVAEVEPLVAGDLVVGWAWQRGLAAAADAGDLARTLRRGEVANLARQLWAWSV